MLICFFSSFLSNISHAVKVEWIKLCWAQIPITPAACVPFESGDQELEEDASVGNSVDQPLRGAMVLDTGSVFWGATVIFFVRLSVNIINLPLTSSETLMGTTQCWVTVWKGVCHHSWQLLAPWHSSIYHSSSSASFLWLVHPVAVITSKAILINSFARFKRKQAQCFSSWWEVFSKMGTFCAPCLDEEFLHGEKHFLGLMFKIHSTVSLPTDSSLWIQESQGCSSCPSLKCLTVCDIKRWNSRNLLDDIHPYVWTWKMATWRNIFYLNNDIWLSLGHYFFLSQTFFPNPGLYTFLYLAVTQEDLSALFLFFSLPLTHPSDSGWLLTG